MHMQKLIIKILRKKVLLLHPHEQNICIEFNKIFPSSKFLIPIRNPIKVYYSLIETRRTKCNLYHNKYYPRGGLVELVDGLDNFRKNNFDMKIIKLEKLGKNTEMEMKKVCDYIGINFDNVLLKSTFGGLKYWGNTINLQRNSYEEKNYDSFINANKTDLKVLEILNHRIFKEFYKEENILNVKKFDFYKVIYPLKDEILFLKDFSPKYILLYIKFIIFYLPKRLYLILKLLLKTSI